MDKEQMIEEALARQMIAFVRANATNDGAQNPDANLGTNELAFEGKFEINRGNGTVEAGNISDVAVVALISQAFRAAFDDQEGWSSEILTDATVFHKVFNLTVPQLFLPFTPGAESGNVAEVLVEGFVVVRKSTKTVLGPEPVPSEPAQDVDGADSGDDG
jgi:hypothetical protein